MKDIKITINMVVDDEEVEPFFNATQDDLMAQADIVNTWLREAPFTQSIDLTISEENMPNKILSKIKFHIQNWRDNFQGLITN